MNKTIATILIVISIIGIFGIGFGSSASCSAPGECTEGPMVMFLNIFGQTYSFILSTPSYWSLL